eukprot:2349720-Rhodomonas_salina.1
MIREISGIRVPPLPTVSFEDPKTGETRDLRWEEVQVMSRRTCHQPEGEKGGVHIAKPLGPG